MSDPSTETDSSPHRRAANIVQDVVRRRRAGEALLDEDVVRAFPDLAGHLTPLLAQAAVVAAAADQADAAPWLNLLDRLDDDSLLQEGGSDQGLDEPARPPEGTSRISLAGGADKMASPPTTPTDFGKSPPGELTQVLADAYPAATRPGGPTDDATPFRPTQRPPQARVHIADDDQVDGEVVRLRDDVTIIGRTRGAITIPHDQQISAEHASITRELQDETYRWFLRDLGSRNGVYARAASALLKHGDVLMLAGHRVRFSDHRPGGACTLEEIGEESSAACLDLNPGSEHWLGRDAAFCEPLLRDASQLSRRHARLYCDGQARWRIEDNQTTNGVWILVDEIELCSGVAFQLGEQRFFFEMD